MFHDFSFNLITRLRSIGKQSSQENDRRIKKTKKIWRIPKIGKYRGGQH